MDLTGTLMRKVVGRGVVRRQGLTLALGMAVCRIHWAGDDLLLARVNYGIFQELRAVVALDLFEITTEITNSIQSIVLLEDGLWLLQVVDGAWICLVFPQSEQKPPRMIIRLPLIPRIHQVALQCLLQLTIQLLFLFHLLHHWRQGVEVVDIFLKSVDVFVLGCFGVQLWLSIRLRSSLLLMVYQFVA